MRAPLPRSLRARLTLLVAMVGVVLLLAAGAGLVVTVQRQLDGALDEGLNARASDVAGAWHSGARTPLADPFAQVLGGRGRVLARSAGTPKGSLLTQDELAHARASGLRLDTWVPEQLGPTRLVARQLSGVVIVVAAPRAALDAARDRLLSLLGALLVGLLLLLTAGTWVLVGAALRPVGRMTAVADSMAADASWAEPLPVPPGGDELSRLARTLNRLLAGLAASLRRERALVDDASHELRTPLTVLRGELELALDEPDPQRQRRGVERALDATERLATLAEDLLVLARETGGTGRPRTVVVLLRWLRETLCGPGAPGGPAVTVSGDDEVRACVEPAAFSRVVSNLVRNAAVAGASRLDVRVERGAGYTLVRFCDDGPGFPTEVLSRAFDRFVRGEAPRSRATGLDGSSGNGLGLAIVRAVVEAHGGSVSAGNDVGAGAVVELRLPVSG